MKRREKSRDESPADQVVELSDTSLKDTRTRRELQEESSADQVADFSGSSAPSAD